MIDYNALISVTGMALMVTLMVDTVRNAVDKDNQILPAAWNFLSFGLGILAVYAFSAGNLHIVVQGLEPNTFGTGLIVGAVASGWHTVLARISPTS